MGFAGLSGWTRIYVGLMKARDGSLFSVWGRCLIMPIWSLLASPGSWETISDQNVCRLGFQTCFKECIYYFSILILKRKKKDHISKWYCFVTVNCCSLLLGELQGVNLSHFYGLQGRLEFKKGRVRWEKCPYSRYPQFLFHEFSARFKLRPASSKMDVFGLKEVWNQKDSYCSKNTGHHWKTAYSTDGELIVYSPFSKSSL